MVGVARDIDVGVNSVTRLLVYVFNLGHLQQWNFAQCHTLFCQSRFKMLQKLNKPSKYCQSLLKFCQSGESLPRLVTLGVKKNNFVLRCPFMTENSYNLLFWIRDLYHAIILRHTPSHTPSQSSHDGWSQ